MPLPAALARFNRIATNRVGRIVAARAPGFGVVRHRGRKSGRLYCTPVNVFRRGDGYVIALTYGSRSDWVRNVTAAGRCELETGRGIIALTQPRVVRDAARERAPALVRPVLRLLGADEFLELRRAD